MDRTPHGHRPARRRGRRHGGWSVLLLLALAPAAAAETRLGGGGELLSSLLGRWSGEAVRTPAGPLPYDIHFRPLGGCAVSGAANPGAAVHSWIFYRDGGALRLRFLSSFRGNTDPLDLAGVRDPDGTVTFRAERRGYVSVRLTPGADAIGIAVALRGEPHVEIRLAREAPAAAAP
jgi:hypothetical protein